MCITFYVKRKKKIKKRKNEKSYTIYMLHDGQHIPEEPVQEKWTTHFKHSPMKV
jgi:hypothetical protein